MSDKKSSFYLRKERNWNVLVGHLNGSLSMTNKEEQQLNEFFHTFQFLQQTEKGPI
jgi:hypothetical protein